MNLKQLPYILAIEANGNLLAASKELGISQPALTKYLYELEQEVGMELFYRMKRQMIPTPAGRLYLDAARKIMRLSTQAADSIHALNHTDYQPIRVGISPHRGATFIARIYPMVMQIHPTCRLIPVEGYSNSLKDKVLKGQIDFAITSHVGQIHPELEAFVSDPEELVLAVPAYYPIVKHSPRTPFNELPFASLEDFDKYSFVMPEPDSALHDAIKPLLRDLSFTPICNFSTPNVMMEKELIRSGVGIGLMPAFYAAPNDEIAFFRLYKTGIMNGCIVKRKDHDFSEAEKYVIYEHLKKDFEKNKLTHTSPVLLDIYAEQDAVFHAAATRQNPFSAPISVSSDDD